MNKLNKFLLRHIVKSELKKKNQVSVIADIYYVLTSYMHNHYKEFDGKRCDFYPHLSDTKKKTFNEFVQQCHLDCVNRITSVGPDREI